MRESTEKAIELLKSLASEGQSIADNILDAGQADASTATTVKSEEKDEVEKGLTASVAASMARQQQLHEFASGQAQDQPAVGTNRTRNLFETPVVPVRHVSAPFGTPSVKTPEMLTDCGQCGYVHKSLEECPKCRVAKSITEAMPLRFRGR